MYQISGLVLMEPGYTGTEIGGVTVVTEAAEAPAYAQKNWVDEVFVNLPDVEAAPQSLMDDFVEMGVTVHLNLSQVTHTPGRVQIVEKVGSYTVLTSSMNYATTKQAFLKRAMDIAGGLVGCLICAVLFVFVAPVLYISSPGPIFFAQERIGKNGKRFQMYKFRSMYIDAEARKAELLKHNESGDGVIFKMKKDPRITPVGRFIRKFRSDHPHATFAVADGTVVFQPCSCPCKLVLQFSLL